MKDIDTMMNGKSISEMDTGQLREFIYSRDIRIRLQAEVEGQAELEKLNIEGRIASDKQHEYNSLYEKYALTYATIALSSAVSFCIIWMTIFKWG